MVETVLGAAVSIRGGISNAVRRRKRSGFSAKSLRAAIHSSQMWLSGITDKH